MKKLARLATQGLATVVLAAVLLRALCTTEIGRRATAAAIPDRIWSRLGDALSITSEERLYDVQMVVLFIPCLAIAGAVVAAAGALLRRRSRR